MSVDLRLLTSRRLDLIHDRVRAINRLRATLLEYAPALEAAFDYSKHKAALTVLTKYATPETLRHLGRARLARWLEAHECRDAARVADAAVPAAEAQRAQLPAEVMGARLVSELATHILTSMSPYAALTATSAPSCTSTPLTQCS